MIFLLAFCLLNNDILKFNLIQSLHFFSVLFCFVVFFFLSVCFNCFLYFLKRQSDTNKLHLNLVRQKQFGQ